MCVCVCVCVCVYIYIYIYTNENRKSFKITLDKILKYPYTGQQNMINFRINKVLTL